MNKKEIINQLIKNRKPFKEIDSFSKFPGIYAIFFYGERFPLNEMVTQDEIIYIGKTESSQESRDANTHFASGKTGSSTLRRTLGALLREELELVPVPRNKKDFEKGRNTFYKFNDYSEVRLTNWMKNNLGLSFFEYPKSPGAIDLLETELIKIVRPVLNLSKNVDNPFGKFIKEQRKLCGQIVFGTATGNEENEQVFVSAHNINDDSTHLSGFIFSESLGDSRSNPLNKYKLHEAMEIVLKELPERSSSCEYVSNEIWKRKLYIKKDGGKAMPDQIKLRAKNYSQFRIIGNSVRLE